MLGKFIGVMISPDGGFNPNRSLDFGEIARLCHAACFWPSRRRSGLRRGVARIRMRTEAGKMPESLIFPIRNGLGVSNDRFGLKWGSPEEGASFILRYSLASPVSWDSVHVMTDTVFLLEDLQPETVYLWSVMSSCLGGNHSGWATRQNFETSPVANEKDDSHGLHVYTTPGQLHLLNPAALPLGRVWIYGTDGHLHGRYQVDSTENVLIRTELSMQVAIVLVESQGRIYRFKVLVY